MEGLLAGWLVGWMERAVRKMINRAVKEGMINLSTTRLDLQGVRREPINSKKR